MLYSVTLAESNVNNNQSLSCHYHHNVLFIYTLNHQWL